MMVAEPACSDKIPLGVGAPVSFWDQVLRCAAVDRTCGGRRYHGTLAVKAEALLLLKCALAALLTWRGQC
jgi:hypothetical protein